MSDDKRQRYFHPSMVGGTLCAVLLTLALAACSQVYKEIAALREELHADMSLYKSCSLQYKTIRSIQPMSAV
uniref:Col_cuticle_N domain-containing protein n=1 Tax=Ascaris lumbricoides TaxID=6252 RepID=A0A0M3IX21_ASCLU